MSMNSGSENFDELRRLLALKRHEQPPPGYWNSFSAKVVGRIEAGECGAPDSFFERFFGEHSFVKRLVAALEAKPALAGAFGVAVCGLLISGVLYSEDAGPATGQGMGLVSSPAIHSSQIAALNTLPESQSFSSTNPAPAFDPGSLFNRANSLLGPQVEPASMQILSRPQGY